jgi:tRNA(Ile)-lysidine synthase TilS/MesJ
MVSALRQAGRGRPYDVMLGLSGGIDSAYLAHLAVRELGLRVLAVHVDGGWNSEPAVRNIESLVRALDLLPSSQTQLQQKQRQHTHHHQNQNQRNTFNSAH